MSKLNLKNLDNLKFKTINIEDYCGLKQNTLHIYIQAGAIKPDIDESHGTGSMRLLSGTNFVECILITHLIKDGLPRRNIVEMMKSTKKDRSLLNPVSIVKRMAGVYLVFYNEKGKFHHRFLIEDAAEKYNRKNAATVISCRNVLSTVVPHLPDLIHIFNLNQTFAMYAHAVINVTNR